MKACIWCIAWKVLSVGMVEFDYSVIVAFDFDGTLTDSDEFGREACLSKKAMKYLRKIQSLDVITVLWTCRHGSSLESCLERLRKAGISFDYVNEDNGRRNSGRKINADVYIDDKANDGKIRWRKTYKRIKEIIKCRKLQMKKK